MVAFAHLLVNGSGAVTETTAAHITWNFQKPQMRVSHSEPRDMAAVRIAGLGVCVHAAQSGK